MIPKRLLALPAAALLCASAANATTYDITGVLDYGANGFGSTLFHDQSCGRMCGGMVADPLSAIGSWDDATGDILFSMTMSGGGTVEATGSLTASITRSDSALGYSPLVGDIFMKFAGVSGIGDGIYHFFYDDTWFNPEANGTNGNHISLWGDLGNYDSGCPAGEFCMGSDFRLAITENSGGGNNGGPAPVPLPGTFGLLALGLAGLAGRKKIRRKPG